MVSTLVTMKKAMKRSKLVAVTTSQTSERGPGGGSSYSTGSFGLGSGLESLARFILSAARL
jgi:hypothetical protein